MSTPSTIALGSMVGSVGFGWKDGAHGILCVEIYCHCSGVNMNTRNASLTITLSNDAISFYTIAGREDDDPF